MIISGKGSFKLLSRPLHACSDYYARTFWVNFMRHVICPLTVYIQYIKNKAMNQDRKNANETGDNIESEISPAERSLLDQSIENSISTDNNNLKRSMLDDRDEDGELMNEKTSADDLAGDDLDIPGAELDDADEAAGEEDEENNGYSDADTE
jgi:hypothetical protein